MTDREQELLLTVAPYVNVNHNFTFFIENLDRLADIDSAKISVVLGEVLQFYLPLHDYNDHLSTLMIKLIKSGMQEDVRGYAESLRNSLPKLASDIFSLTDRGAVE